MKAPMAGVIIYRFFFSVFIGTLDDPTCMIPEVYNIMNQDDAYPVLEDVVQPAVEDMTQPAAESTLQSVECPEKCRQMYFLIFVYLFHLFYFVIFPL